MVNPSNCGRGRFRGATALAFAVIFLAARPAAAQIWIAPDRSVVNIGPQQPLVFQGSYTVNPVVVPGNMFVRVSGSYSAVFINPMSGYPGTGFVKPFSATDRARASNFPGSANYNPRPVLTGPWQRWW